MCFMALFASLMKRASDNFSKSSSVTVFPLLNVGLAENLDAAAPAAPAAAAPASPVASPVLPG